MFAEYQRPLSTPERIERQVLGFFDYLGGTVERFYEKSLRVELTEALISGFCTGLVLSVLGASKGSIGGLDQIQSLKIMFFTLGCYLAVALVCHQLWIWATLAKPMIPSWILTPVFGSLFSASFIAVPMTLAHWWMPDRIEPDPGRFFSLTVIAWIAFLFILNLFSIPMTASIHYLGPLVKRMRR
ncbi:MAG: hypothetical protein JWM21_1398 [Acidobacteria bacterium]|nr:hypothetical protein [Acidobacteriota bacterium]